MVETATNTHWGIWLKRAGRYGQREYRKMYGWVDRTLAASGKLDADICLPTDTRHGYRTRDEAESAALLLTALHPWSVGWLDVRLFYGYRDQHGNFVSMGR